MINKMKSRINSDTGAVGTIEIVLIIAIVVVLVIAVFQMISNSTLTQAQFSSSCIADPSKKECRDYLNKILGSGVINP